MWLLKDDEAIRPRGRGRAFQAEETMCHCMETWQTRPVTTQLEVGCSWDLDRMEESKEQRETGIRLGKAIWRK